MTVTDLSELLGEMGAEIEAANIAPPSFAQVAPETLSTCAWLASSLHAEYGDAAPFMVADAIYGTLANGVATYDGLTFLALVMQMLRPQPNAGEAVH